MSDSDALVTAIGQVLELGIPALKNGLRHKPDQSDRDRQRQKDVLVRESEELRK